MRRNRLVIILKEVKVPLQDAVVVDSVDLVVVEEVEDVVVVAIHNDMKNNTMVVDQHVLITTMKVRSMARIWTIK